MGRRIFLAILAVFTSVATAQAQAGGRITGRVTATEGNRPIPNVQVVLVGTARGAVTDTGGRYTIVDAPTGTHTVATRALGWGQRSTTVTVTAGGTATADFTLESAPAALNPVVVTGYDETDRRAVTGARHAAKSIEVPTRQPHTGLVGPRG